MKLVLATRNEHKLTELRGLLPGHEILPLPEEVELPPETGDTFEANAMQKAITATKATGLPAIADDSGIEAAALGGRPGVRSARYAGEGATDEENLAKLIDEVPDEGDRRVRYVCALAYATPDGERRTFFGVCDGELTGRPRGTGGFGYDPAFVPVDYEDGRTMAELTVPEKEAVSHRGRAARAFRAWLEESE